jgi:hypothetical protein
MFELRSRAGKIAFGFVVITLTACSNPRATLSLMCSDAGTAPRSTVPTVCTAFVRDTLFDDYLASDSWGPAVSGVTGTGVADMYVALSNGFQGKVARWDGSAWATETLPSDPFAIGSMATDTSGEPWAVIAERSSSRSGIGGPSAVIHRRNGGWVLESKPPSRDVGSLAGTSSGLFVFASDPVMGGGSIWGWQDRAWLQFPMMLSGSASAMSSTFGVSGIWGGGCGQALAYGGGTMGDTLAATLLRLDGTSWLSVPVQALSDIVAVSGPSVDELYVLAWNRNQDGTSRMFHVTNRLQTWTPLQVPATVDYRAISSPGPSLAVAVGCEWPDKTVAAAPDCARATTFTGETAASAALLGVQGQPVGLWAEPQTGALHLFTAAAASNGLFRAQHYVAPAQCP